MSLRSQPVVVLDCQATGASPSHGHLLELGWLVTRAEDEPQPTEVRSSLVALPEGATIPPIVAGLTGVTTEQLEGAPRPVELWDRLRHDVAPIADAHGNAIAVVHFARFEQSFLGDLHAREHPGTAFPLRMICTHEIARRLFPGLPRRGLRALAGWCGHATEELLRSAGHVWATALVWRELSRQLDEQGIADVDALFAWLDAPAPKAGKRVYAMPREKRLGLPDAPGVYRMLRTSGDVLYVGKATSLRDRVNSYFRKQTKVPDRLLELLSQARDLEVTPTASILEAALLETDEIKRINPPFNQALREQGRAPWFASSALDRLAPAPARALRVGPLGSQWSARRFTALVAALGGALEGDAWRRAVLVAAGRPGLTVRPGANVEGAIEVDDAVLREGLAAFASALPERGLDLRRAGALGAALWKAQLEAGAEPEALEDEAVEQQIWSAADVHEHLAEAVMMLAHALRRARWLRALSEASVAFVDGAAARRLVVERGRIVVQADHDPGVLPAVPPGWAKGAGARRRSFDVATFDRLRVLTTELRRVATAGGPVTVRLGPKHVLAGERLRRLLAWV